LLEHVVLTVWTGGIVGSHCCKVSSDNIIATMAVDITVAFLIIWFPCCRQRPCCGVKITFGISVYFKEHTFPLLSLLLWHYLSCIYFIRFSLAGSTFHTDVIPTPQALTMLLGNFITDNKLVWHSDRCQLLLPDSECYIALSPAKLNPAAYSAVPTSEIRTRPLCWYYRWQFKRVASCECR
jgi:hypothetical protein